MWAGSTILLVPTENRPTPNSQGCYLNIPQLIMWESSLRIPWENQSLDIDKVAQHSLPINDGWVGKRWKRNAKDVARAHHISGKTGQVICLIGTKSLSDHTLWTSHMCMIRIGPPHSLNATESPIVESSKKSANMQEKIVLFFVERNELYKIRWAKSIMPGKNSFFSLLLLFPLLHRNPDTYFESIFTLLPSHPYNSHYPKPRFS